MKQNVFDLIPVISKHITTENEGGLLVITFPRFRSKFMQRYFVPRNKSAIIRIRLDEHGTAVWGLIDGKRSVKGIAEQLAAHFQQEENYEYRIAEFMLQLYKQGFVKI
ncbi:MAG: PqqD family protein [Bacteroidales bacterium]|nr:PqqD family protein [Bacteroidales bacterium]MCL2738768.1 PqqD family protein [Bacteroidales bacterium]